MVSISPISRPDRALPADVPGLLRQMLSDNPGRPRVTWYGRDRERVELSAKVLDNWVAKTANLLVDDLDLGPGQVVRAALPAHWRSITWYLAVWAVGACVEPVDPLDPAAPTSPNGPDVLVAADARLLAGARAVNRSVVPVGVALPALATAFGPGLPPGGIDAAASVRVQGDTFVPLVEPVAADDALRLPERTLSHGELMGAAAALAGEAGWPDQVRVFSGVSPAQLPLVALAAFARGGSIVLRHDSLADQPAELERIRDYEKITSQI